MDRSVSDNDGNPSTISLPRSPSRLSLRAADSAIIVMLERMIEWEKRRNRQVGSRRGKRVHAPQDLISQMRDYTRFLAELGQVTAETVSAPMGEGKWSVHDVVAHIMAWDVNFLETTVLAIEAGQQPPIAEEADFQAFNERAAAVGRRMTKEHLLDKATRARVELVEHLQRLPSQAFPATQQGATTRDLAGFLDRNFVSHDKHHVDQMKAYLAAHKVARG